jgi:Protein of unknown function (DUF3043)
MWPHLGPRPGITTARSGGPGGPRRYAERVFRRRSADPPETVDQEPQSAAEPEIVIERAGMTPAKGRPTPKRSEAEKRRRQPFAAPADRKAAAQQSRSRDRGERSRKMDAMRRGESWALPRKDQGPVRALARDYVDSRRSVSEYYMFGVVVLIVLLFVPTLRKSLAVDYAVLVMLLVIVTEASVVGRRVVRLAQQRFPGESTRGVKMYAAIRGTQFRRLRMPAPRVKPGDKI